MKLINGDALTVVEQFPTRVKCIFADPPDNIGLAYSQYNDNRSDYYSWLFQLIGIMVRQSQVCWISYHSMHDLEVSRIVNFHLGKKEARKIIWRFTFGNYNPKDFGYGYRPILRIKDKDCVLYPDHIREESERMRTGDSRANGPRVPDDVWDFPRVTGNSQERQPWHPTQHPVILYNRILRYSCQQSDCFVDMFAGSGTCFRAGLLAKHDNVIGIEIDPAYCASIRINHALA